MTTTRPIVRRIRAVGFPDLLVAAIAERHRMTVWHYEGDFDLIQAVTAQEMSWVVPRGSVPLRPSAPRDRVTS